MDVGSLAAGAVATQAQQTRDGFTIAALRIAHEQQQAMADLVAQTAADSKALTEAGVGTVLDVSA